MCFFLFCAVLQDIFRGRCKTLFLEMLCTDAALIHRNVLEKARAQPTVLNGSEGIHPLPPPYSLSLTRPRAC